MDKKTWRIYMLSTREPLQNKRHTQTKNEGMEKNIPCKRWYIFIWCSITYIWQNKLQNKVPNNRRQKGHYIILKGSLQQENITLVNIYALNIGTPKYVKINLLVDFQRQIGSNTVIVRYFNTLLTSMDRCVRQKIHKGIVMFNDTLDHMDLIYIFRAFNPKAVGYTYFLVHMEHFPGQTTC